MNPDLQDEYDLPEFDDPSEVAQWAEYWVQEQGRVFTSDELFRMVFLYGKQEAPEILADLRWASVMSEEEGAKLVCAVWEAAEAPAEMAGDDEWALLFGWVGFIRDGALARRPRKVKTLYRGSDDEHREGWSWTDDRKTAQWFADRWASVGRPGKVWTAQVEPADLLANITTRDEHEWVVSVHEGIEITEAPPLPAPSE